MHVHATTSKPDRHILFFVFSLSRRSRQGALLHWRYQNGECEEENIKANGTERWSFEERWISKVKWIRKCMWESSVNKWFPVVTWLFVTWSTKGRALGRLFANITFLWLQCDVSSYRAKNTVIFLFICVSTFLFQLYSIWCTLQGCVVYCTLHYFHVRPSRLHWLLLSTATQSLQSSGLISPPQDLLM